MSASVKVTEAEGSGDQAKWAKCGEIIRIMPLSLPVEKRLFIFSGQTEHPIYCYRNHNANHRPNPKIQLFLITGEFIHHTGHRLCSLPFCAGPNCRLVQYFGQTVVQPAGFNLCPGLDRHLYFNRPRRLPGLAAPGRLNQLLNCTGCVYHPAGAQFFLVTCTFWLSFHNWRLIGHHFALDDRSFKYPLVWQNQ